MVGGIGDIEGVFVEGEALGVVEAGVGGGAVAEAGLSVAEDAGDVAGVGLGGEDAVMA